MPTKTTHDVAQAAKIARAAQALQTSADSLRQALATLSEIDLKTGENKLAIAGLNGTLKAINAGRMVLDTLETLALSEAGPST